jgi:sugar-specific transcriptional regulator TrmB
MLEKLKKLGLTEYEAKIYMTLVEHGSMDTKQLSVNSKVPQNRIYELAISLENKGFVKSLVGAPKKLEAIDFDSAKETFIRKKKEDLQRELKGIRAMTLELVKIKETVKNIGFWTFSGRERKEYARKRLSLRKDNIKKEWLSVISIKTPYEYPKSLEIFFKSLKNKKIKVRIIISNTPEGKKFARMFTQWGAEVKIKELPPDFKFEIYDDRILFLESTEGDPQREWFFMWTNSSSLKSIFRDYFQKLWE